MATLLRETDAVVIGVGWTGAILARELTKAGLHVVGLERGPMRTAREDFAIPSVRHAPAETALPIRRLGSFLPGTGLGGAGEHWNGVTWRLTPTDHLLRSHITQRYGRDAIPAEMTIADYPVSYDELEPYYDRFEKLAGISGKAGNLRGKLIDGGNVFEGSRQNEYPNKPLTQSMAGATMEAACKSLGYHPFPGPAAIASASAAKPTPKHRRMPASFRCCCRMRNSSCAPMPM